MGQRSNCSALVRVSVVGASLASGVGPGCVLEGGRGDSYYVMLTWHAQVTMSLVCGGTAGLISSTLTFPLDLIRRRMQLEGQGGARRQASLFRDATCPLERSLAGSLQARNCTSGLSRRLQSEAGC